MPISLAESDHAAGGVPVDEMCRMAAELEESGELEAAAEMYRAAMAAAGPSAEICFQLAELLYRLGDLSAARERYYMAVELDEDYVEARANLGCVLAETGQRDLAVAAFRGRWPIIPTMPTPTTTWPARWTSWAAATEARPHWQAFLDQAPDSPWADERPRPAGRHDVAAGMNVRRRAAEDLPRLPLRRGCAAAAALQICVGRCILMR